jgi:Uncharacterized protein conserved in bacteria (DUF2252)
MKIQQATRSYEDWMRRCTTVVESDLRAKHQRMKDDPFLFFRGTFYRWTQLWPSLCAGLCNAPAVLASGDLHVGSFGTWRDAEGRLCWGVTDFDEAHRLPYTNDLVRLAASVKMARDAGFLGIRLKAGCGAILDGYRKTLKTGGAPFVLAEHENHLEKLGVDQIQPPNNFWKRLQELPLVRRLPHDVKPTLEKTLPDPGLDYKIVRREVGMGSLGQQRFVAIAAWEGGFIAREAKAMVPSACEWLAGREGRGQSNYQKAIQSAVRSHDPFQKIAGRWLIRRLSPDSNTVDLATLSARRDEEILLRAMGSEAANIHLGSKRQVWRILADLRRRKSNWLRVAAKQMAEASEHDWKVYKKS